MTSRVRARILFSGLDGILVFGGDPVNTLDLVEAFPTLEVSPGLYLIEVEVPQGPIEGAVWVETEHGASETFRESD